MKKLMIAAAIVCAAALSQAATVGWGVSGIKADGGADPTAGWKVLAFYTEVGAGSDAIVSAINNKTAGSLAFDEQGITVSMHKGKWGPGDKAVDAITDTSKNKDFYFVIFNSDDVATATKYAMVSAPNKEYSSVDGKYAPTGDFSTLPTWNDIGSPEPTPEPTSGLLLLIGVAGLALRRKQA